MLTKITVAINKWMAGISVTLIVVVILSIAADVALRYITGVPLVGVVELNRTILVVIVFFTLGYTQVRKRHINAEFLINKVSAGSRAWVEAIIYALSLAIAIIITYGSVSAAYISTIEGEHEVGVLKYPLWPGRIAMAAGMFMLSCQYAIDLYQSLRTALPAKEHK